MKMHPRVRDTAARLFAAQPRAMSLTPVAESAPHKRLGICATTACTTRGRCVARFYWPMRECIGGEHFDRYSEQQRVTA
jgi:hypothetical protein